MRENKQYLRTHQAIQSAFLKLLSKKPFEKMTVQDILETAPLSRATFYKHFRDKFEIAEALQDEILRAWENLHFRLEHAEPENTEMLIENFVARYRDMARLLLDIETERVNLSQAFAQISEKHYLKISQSPGREVEARIYGAIISVVVLEVLQDDRQFSLSEISEVLRSVALYLMGLQDDPEAAGLIPEKYWMKM